MVHRTAMPTTTVAAILSNGMDDHIGKGGDSGGHGIHHSGISSTSSKAILNDKLLVYFSDKEPLDYRPSPVRDKEQEESKE
jgi:hypothetical protein